MVNFVFTEDTSHMIVFREIMDDYSENYTKRSYAVE